VVLCLKCHKQRELDGIRTCCLLNLVRDHVIKDRQPRSWTYSPKFCVKRGFHILPELVNVLFGQFAWIMLFSFGHTDWWNLILLRVITWHALQSFGDSRCWRHADDVFTLQGLHLHQQAPTSPGSWAERKF